MRGFLFKRNTKIPDDQGMKNKGEAQTKKIIEKAKKAALKEKEKILAQSRLDSENIIKDAERRKEIIIAAAYLEAERIIQEGKDEIMKEKEKLKSDKSIQYHETGRMEMLLSKVYDGHKIL
ncbi:MAG: hypothetical protein ACMUJM_20310 [bacterium]